MRGSWQTETKRRTAICLSLVLLTIAHRAVAQPPAIPSDVLSSSALPAPHLSKDRTTLVQFLAVAKAIAAEDLVSTSLLVRKLFDLGEDRWFGEGPRAVGMRRDLGVQLQRLSPRLATLYTQELTQRIQPEVEAALLTRDRAALLRIANQYPDSRPVRMALMYAASLSWDRGDFGAAAALGMTLLPGPESAAAGDSALILQTTAALAQAGRADRAALLLESYAHIFEQDTTPVSQQRLQQVRQWIKDSLQQQVATISQRLTYPAVAPRWTASVLNEPSWTEIFDLEYQEQRNSGFHALPAAIPYVAGSRIFLRTYAGLQARDLTSGQVLWESPVLTTTADGERDRRAVDNPGFRDFKGKELYRFLIQNQVAGSCVADDQRLYVIGERFLASEGQDEIASPTGRLRNQVVACRLEDGQPAWQSWTRAELADVYFLSRPLLRDQRLFVVGETDSQMKLYVFRTADGQLDWELPLAALKHDLQLHPARRHRQVVTAWNDEQLICASGSGCVLAVDVARRSYIWAWRYPTREMIPRTAARMGPFGDMAKVIPYTGWQRIGLVQYGELIFLASTEAEGLMALNCRTGEPVWEQPREDGLCLAGICAGKLLVVGYRSLRALEPETGKLVWERSIERPSGMGLIRGDRFLIPLETGPVLLIDGATGKTLRGAQGDQPPLGNLDSVQDLLVSLTPTRLEVYGEWEQERQELLARLNASPDNPELLQELYLQMRRGGDVAQVVDLLRGLYQKQPNTALRVQLIQTLLTDWRESPAKQATHVPELRRLLTELGTTPLELRARIAALTALDDRPPALQAALQLAPQVSPDQFELTTDHQTLVRSDRAIQGLIRDLIYSANPSDRATLDEIMEHALRSARDGNDPFGLQRFALLYSELPWGQAARLRSPAKVGIGWPAFRQELSLLDLVEAGPRDQAAAACLKLAQEMAQRSFRTDAVRYYERLRREFGDLRLDDSRTAAELTNEIPATTLLGQQLRSGIPDPWPLTKPAISKPRDRAREPFLMPLPISAESGSLLDRINVSVDTQSQKLVFQGDWYPGYWEVSLPKSRSALRELIQTYQGWGLGQLLVVRMGTHLHGVSPLDNTGEPNARVVWSLELAEDLGERFDVVEVQSRQGLVEAEVVIYDEFGREVGQICEMLPGYFCYRYRNEVIAVETSTGRTLWRRRLPHEELRVTGDAQYVYILHFNDRTLERIRVLDGVAEARQPWPFPLEMRGIYQQGVAIISEPQKSEYRLQWINLRTLQVTAEHVLPRISHRFFLDPYTLAVFQQDRILVWFDARTGWRKGQRELAVPQEPERLSRIHSWQDQKYFYVLPTAIPPYTALGQGAQVRGGYRQHRVKGTLHAIDRQTGEIRWQRDLEDVVFPQDQPRGAPVFVLNYRVLAPGVQEASRPPAAGQTESVLHLLDRRTGEDIYREQSATSAPERAVEINLEHRALDIHGVTDRLRLEYPSN